MADPKSEASFRDFHHPYDPPYAIQTQFMNALYDCIEQGKVGIFESPTGTGKSLSLICGSLTWLRDHKRRVFKEGSEVLEEPDWMLEHARKEKVRAARQRRADVNERLANIRKKEEKARQTFELGQPPHKKQKISTDHEAPDSVEAEFLLDDYDSEDESFDSPTSGGVPDSFLSAETQALIDQLGGNSSALGKDTNDYYEDELKIFFCSRTHSQLAQFVGELRRIHMPPSVPPAEHEEAGNGANETISEEIKHLSLGSRKNLCINDKVSKLGNVTAINERCLELQQSSTSQEAKCKYVPTREKESLINDFRDHTLAKIRDIEDLGNLGKRLGVCPYYASRAAIRPSEIITLPYPLLLQRSAREALDLSLKDHVIIVDEAHNLLDAITNIHSVQISLAQLKQSRLQLGIYLQKFRNRLKGKNRAYVTQLVRLIDSIAGYLEAKHGQGTSSEGQAQIADMMAGKGVDQINLYKLMRYLQESKLARKVEGYYDFTQLQQIQMARATSTSSTRPSTTPTLSQIQNFLNALTNPAKEGRFFYSRPDTSDGSHDQIGLRYLLLDPTQHFKDVVDEVRAVILAGGTMSPMTDYTSNLFHYLPRDRIQTLSCGHVIPSSNLFASPISKGPGDVEFDFTLGKRQSPSMIVALGQSILQLSHIIPDGLVIFFPSYTYLASAVQTWQKPVSKNDASLWELISSLKCIFMEPGARKHLNPASSTKTDQTPDTVDSVLEAYGAHIHSLPANTHSSTHRQDSNATSTSPAKGNKGAILLAVINGSLSEGINFADRLGRGVIVVGLPFANPHSPEWKAKAEFIEGREANPSAAAAASREFYEYTCMRSVNQSIGRAIRHKDDYAAILLLDRRYRREGIRKKLPGWIRESLVIADDGFGQTLEGLEKFFEGKRLA